MLSVEIEIPSCLPEEEEMAIYHMFVSILISLPIAYCITDDTKFCAKFEYHHISRHDNLLECTQPKIPNFVMSSYTSAPSIKPYRNNSLYFLSNKPNSEYTCATFIRKFSMNATTRIMAAVFLKAPQYAAIEILVYNMEISRRQQVFFWTNSSSLDQSSAWFMIHGKITETIPNAVVRPIFCKFR